LLIWEKAPVYSKKLGDAGAFINKFTENTKPSRIAINAGDVVLFNSCIPHGVASFTWDRPSIAQQTFFIGDPTKPIEFYN
jgi:ectoine hydroxylase-related dioxygenase (phytanoyl-CoA dioxygenase family)